jgi:hypothetical protein
MEGWKTLGVITIGIALLILYSRYKRFGFLVNDYRTRNLEDNIGRKGGDNLYIIFCIGVIFLGLFFIFRYP